MRNNLLKMIARSLVNFWQSPMTAGNNYTPMERSNNSMDDSIREILSKSRTIAVVGLSNNPSRYSNLVAKYLKDHGYRIVPVNPNISEALGESAYPDLNSIPFPVDLVDVFRNTQAAGAVVTQAIDLGIPVVWLQLGINLPDVQDLAANTATICIDKCCIKAEHHRLMK